MRTICVVTNNRADYSKLKTVLASLKNKEDVRLLLFVTGSHLLPEYGETVRDIERDGFDITYTMHTEVNGRIPTTMAKSTGVAVSEFASAFHNFKPDMVVVHGDRYEAFAAAIAASFMNIFVAHIEGGEVTGTIDEHIRHSISKLAHAHFTATQEAKERVIKLGEREDYVFYFGCPGSDALLGAPELTFAELKEKIAPHVKKTSWYEQFNNNFILAVQHPVTTEFATVGKTVTPLLKALTYFDNPVIIMWPNIDAGAGEIVSEIKTIDRENERFGVFPHFPFDVYANLMRHAAVMVGNSSSGVREAGYFGTPVVNIGTRQEGRLRGGNVVDAPYDEEEIIQAITQQLAAGRYTPQYLYGTGDAGKNIADKLATIDISTIQKRITF